MAKSNKYIGLGVHKETIAVAVADGTGGEVRYLGEIANQPSAVKRLCNKLSRGSQRLRFCYEAGPCGYDLYRQIIAAGHACVVVAPGLILRKPGDRIKTDRRDAMGLPHRAPLRGPNGLFRPPAFQRRVLRHPTQQLGSVIHTLHIQGAVQLPLRKQVGAFRPWIPDQAGKRGQRPFSR